MAQCGFLLIGRNEGIAAQVVPALQSFAVVRRARLLTDGLAVLGQKRHWAGIIVDSDDLSVELDVALAQLRAQQQLVPVLVIAARVDGALVNRVQAQRAELVVKPLNDENLVCFARRGLAFAYVPDERVAARVEALARSLRLTSRECQLVSYVLGNESRARIINRLGISNNTLKTQVRMLLRKCGAPSLDALATTLLRDALLFDEHGETDDGELQGPLQQAG